MRETETERKRERERERRGETLCSSSSCYFNPDSALKYGHHVDPLKKCGSSVDPANQRRRSSPGGGTWGRVFRSRSLREALKVCEQRRRVRATEATSPGQLDYPQTNGDRLDHLFFLNYSALVFHSTHWGDSLGERLGHFFL